jgi:hypothetical protein
VIIGIEWARLGKDETSLVVDVDLEAPIVGNAIVSPTVRTAAALKDRRRVVGVAINPGDEFGFD